MKQHWKKIVYSIITLSLLVSCIQGVFRIKAEEGYKNLQIAVRYTDIIGMSQQTGLPMEQILQTLKDKGATTIFVRENTLMPNGMSDLSNWKAQGKLTLYEGYHIQNQYSHVANIEDIIKPELSYIRVQDDILKDYIVNQLILKKLGGKEINLDSKTYIEYRGTTGDMTTLGMGYPLEDLGVMAGMGYVISPQAKSWPGPNEETIENFIHEIDNIPGLGPVYFADNKVTGALSNQMEEFAKEHQLGLIEFFSQRQEGLPSLIRKGSSGGTHYKTVKLHTLTDQEANKLSLQAIISRYLLAITERNQQVLLFKMPTTSNIDENFIMLQTQIEKFSEKAQAEGFTISGDIGNYNLPGGNFILALLSGIGAIGVFILFLDFIGQRRVGLILGLVGLVGYMGILKLRPNMALQLMALFGASIYPSYAVICAIENKPKNLRETIWLFLRTCALSFGGAITIVGLLSRTNFGLTLDLFTGVKLAHLLPMILVIGGYLYKKQSVSMGDIKNLLQNKVTYLAIMMMAFMGVILAIYTLRTGNVGEISSAEVMFRSALDRILGVRPRTKEFMIGYPLMIALFYYGYQEKYLVFLALSIIGQISLVNTYAHIHTPLLISLTRSGYGIAFGLINGIILIYILKMIIKVVGKWNITNE